MVRQPYFINRLRGLRMGFLCFQMHLKISTDFSKIGVDNEIVLLLQRSEKSLNLFNNTQSHVFKRNLFSHH